MKASFFAPILALTAAVAPSIASAQTATQTVTFAVNAINQISATGSPSLTVTTATAGSQPTDATDASSTWAVTTNQSNAKISASIPTAMPAGLTLSVNLVAPAGASSAGLTALGIVAVDLVTAITKVAQNGLTATYQLSATAAAGVVGSGTKVVTYTIAGGT
jgi:outer membrane lipopolysaccharide assembly protein LptE/RlpB